MKVETLKLKVSKEQNVAIHFHRYHLVEVEKLPFKSFLNVGLYVIVAA